MRELGAAPLSARRGLTYRVVNPLDHAVGGPIRLLVDHFEFHDLGFGSGAVLTDVAAATEVPCQLHLSPPGGEFVAHVELEAGEERDLELSPAARPSSLAGAFDRSEAGRSEPAAGEEPTCPGQLVTPFVRIAWEPGDGIVSWLDRAVSRDLLRPDLVHAAFTPVHEVTPMTGRDEAWDVRGRMGLNRKGENVVRSAGCLIGGSLRRSGDVSVSAVLDYGLPGASLCEVELTAYLDAPRVDVSVRMHKDSVWEPENVYLSLPFTTGAPDAQLWLDKAGAAVRPRVDQIPGTLTDFYSVQEGFAVVSDDYGVAVATPDSNLLQLGALEHGPRLLAGDPALEGDPALPYAWLMTNYWETNFSAELGGFYEFRYSVLWGDELAGEAPALAACRDANLGICALRLAGGETSR